MSKFSEEKHRIARQQLGLFFAERRKEMGHSCKDLADFIGITENTMQRIEQGKYDYDIMLLFRICEALEIKPYFVPYEDAINFEDNFSDISELKKPKLEDAHTMSLLHGSTFEVPSNEHLSKLKPSDLIKVNAFGERFWCRIISIDFKDKKIVAVVENELVNSDEHGLKIGDEISVSFNNIYSIY